MSPTLFIDANQYLNLYRMVAGKKLLDSLEEQKAYIFVSAQIVDEVLRNKLRCAHDFFSDKLKEIQTINAPVPDHLLGISDEETTGFRKIIDQAEQARKRLDKLVAETLLQLSRSEDDVSKRLEALFDKSVLPSSDEMQRARERKERGNPPGKPGYPLGDEITWEQLLTNCKESKSTRLWIVTGDQDYCIKRGKDFLLNPLLRRNLVDVCGAALDIYCFGDLLQGIKHFGENADVKADKLPTKKEEAEIRKEIEDLPPLGWLTDTDDAVLRNIIALQARSTAVSPAFIIPLGIAPAIANAGAGSIGSTPPAGDTTETPK